MTEEEFEFESGGHDLFGVFTRAPGGTGDALVIMIHGGPGGDHRGPGDIFVKTARSLARKGIDSFRFDFRGSGNSTGDFVDTTIGGEVDDLVAALDFALEHGYTKIGLLGESMGGTVAVLGKDPSYKALVLWYPAIDLMDTSMQQYFSDEHAEELFNDGFVTDGGFKIGRRLLEEVERIDLKPFLSEISQPVLFVHGDADEEVPYTQSIEAAKLIKTECQVEIIRGSDHCFRRAHEQRRAVKLTVDWFVQHLA